MKYLLVIVFVLLINYCPAQNVPKNLSIADFLKETQQFYSQDNNVKLVWWLPAEFWDVAANNDTSIKKSDMDVIKNAFKDYTVIIAVDAIKIKESGADKYEYTSYDEVKKHLKLENALNNEYKPLNDSELSNTAILFRAQLAPALINMIGDIGKGGNIYFFKDRKDVNTSDATKKGSFTLLLDGVPFKWKLPLPSMMPPKYCPVDKKRMEGDWLYCPYHGVKLAK